MSTGAPAAQAIYPICKTSVLAWKDFGKIGLAETIGVSPRIIVAAVWTIVLGLFVWFEKKRL